MVDDPLVIERLPVPLLKCGPHSVGRRLPVAAGADRSGSVARWWSCVVRAGLQPLPLYDHSL